jgi:hypothetical protein
VVIVIIDGPRWTETFGDPTHTYADQMWNVLRPQGTICTNFRNEGGTYTLAGHTAVLTGTWQGIANDGSERPDNPTIFEYFRKSLGEPQGEAVILGGKDKLSACTYSSDPVYGSAYAATNELYDPTDVETFDRLQTILQNDKPRLVMVSFSDVDQIAHSNDWTGYLNAIGTADSLVTLTWNTLQSNPHYRDKTYMFVTADHGRHDDAHGGFRNHGDSCEGCRHLIFLALGPTIQQDHEESSLYTQRDVCETAGAILGVSTPNSNGVYMTDIFEPVMTGILE